MNYEMHDGRHFWENWSGSVRFQFGRLLCPRSEEEIIEAVQNAKEHQRTLRVVGSSHSSTEIYSTDDTLMSTENLTGAISCDGDVLKVRPGTNLKDLGEIMLSHGLSPTNLGDVALQTIGGAIGTGTHGTGIKFGNLSTMLVGGKIINGKGEVIEFDETSHDFLQAARVSLGMLGIFSEMNLKLLPKTRLKRCEYFSSLDYCLEHLSDFIDKNRHFDFYWYPRSDEVKLRMMNLPEESWEIPEGALKDEESEDWSQNILHKHTEITNRFEEMEYELPLRNGLPCFMEVRERIIKKWRHLVGWRVLYRTIAKDSSLLSPAFGRDSVSISIHQNAGLPYQEFFFDIEPIFRAYEGRPHWAKKHSMESHELQKLYPGWDKFFRIREEFDPTGVFLTPYLRRVFGIQKELI